MTRQINLEPSVDDDVEVIIDLTTKINVDYWDQYVLIVKATSEGVIMDFFLDGELVGTIASTYEEWLDKSQPRG